MARGRAEVYGDKAFWVKGEEARLLREGALGVIIRQGDRSDRVTAPKQWLPLGEPIPVRFIKVPGNQAEGTPPVFDDDDGTTVIIVRRSVSMLQHLPDGDLTMPVTGGRAVSLTAQGVVTYLAEELCPGRQFAPTDLITVYGFVRTGNWADQPGGVAPSA